MVMAPMHCDHGMSVLSCRALNNWKRLWDTCYYSFIRAFREQYGISVFDSRGYHLIRIFPAGCSTTSDAGIFCGEE